MLKSIWKKNNYYVKIHASGGLQYKDDQGVVRNPALDPSTMIPAMFLIRDLSRHLPSEKQLIKTLYLPVGTK